MCVGVFFELVEWVVLVLCHRRGVGQGHCVGHMISAQQTDIKKALKMLFLFIFMQLVLGRAGACCHQLAKKGHSTEKNTSSGMGDLCSMPIITVG